MAEVQGQKLTAELVLKSLAAGGVAGMTAKTVVAPLDRVKILFQAQNPHYKNLGVGACLRKVVMTENAGALFKGNGAQMVRVFPYAALQFTCYEMLKLKLAQVPGLDSSPKRVDFLAGSTAGVISTTATFPLDTIRARLAFQVREKKYRGIINTGQAIFRNEGGVRGLYRGLLPTLIGIVPYAGLTFLFFEMAKSSVLKHCPWACKTSGADETSLQLSVPARLVCGGLSGALAQTSSYPLDVARRRMQLGQFGAGASGAGMTSVLMTTYQEAGVLRGLFRGLTINYYRAIPMTAVSFAVYESMKQAMGMETGLKIRT